MQVLELKNGSLHDSLKYFRRSQVNGIAPGYGDWYAVEQIEDNTYRTLGMMKMAKFFPNMSDGSRLFKLSETCKNPYCRKHKECNNKLNTEKFVINDKFETTICNHLRCATANSTSRNTYLPNFSPPSSPKPFRLLRRRHSTRRCRRRGAA